MHTAEQPKDIPRSTLRRDLAIVSAACLLLLVPFIHKPIHLDDPMYVWAARQISVHPLDFYGFDVNWEGSLRPMAAVMKNPPLVCYFLALVGKTIGWSETDLHGGVLIFSIMAAVGIYLLATELCERPLLATLLAIGCPAFLVSATSLMCDVPMLCFWVWSVLLWMRGSRGATALLPIAGGLAGAAVLTKYSAVNLIPLLFLWAILNRSTGKVRAVQLASLAIPILLLGGFEKLTAVRYGQGFMSAAAHFAVGNHALRPVSNGFRTLDALAYLGCGMLAVALVMVVASGRIWVGLFAVLAALLAWVAHHLVHHAEGWLAFAPIARAAGISPVSEGQPAWWFDIQFGILAASGIAVILSSVAPSPGTPGEGRGEGDSELRTILEIPKHPARAGNRRRSTLFLLAWTIGVFVFAACLNWTINTRTMLPMLPAVCILVARRVEARFRLPIVLAALTGVIVSITVAFGDYQLAVANRNAAASLDRQTVRVWFSGHWGFQFYMQQHGALPLDESAPAVAAGDLLIVALDNYSSPHLDGMVLVGKLEVDPGIGATTMCQPLGANFFGSDGNQLPFVIRPVPPEPFVIFRALPLGGQQVK